MVNYWKAKVLPKIKKVFENPKKTAAVEACKAFDESKEQYSNEFEEKKSGLQPKVIEIYEACSAEVKTLIKEPKETTLKKHSAAVQKFLDELAKIEFPGSKPVCEAATKVGPGYLPGPVFFVFEKVSTFIVTDEKKEETETAATTAAAEETKEEVKEEPTGSTTEVAEKEIVATEEESTPPPPPPPAVQEESKPAAAASDEPPKTTEDDAPKAETKP